ncbi:hypothetical protein N478_11395 [Pseudoalteromonas luteoviolacea S4060-1]|uniref:Lipoprotein n=1 Tax=Pseudoalteromonas luteoviolacea S4060-1 TaxID=1365257 RepID=A0A161Z0E3_9GAMM|nr:hypothetical protein N478_11395 [Pseudoalteromonas luteoviolacea S4060-1]
MIKVIVICFSTFLVILGCVGFTFGEQIGIEPKRTHFLLFSAIGVIYGIGYEIILKNWGLKKVFYIFHIAPFVFILTNYLLDS